VNNFKCTSSQPQLSFLSERELDDVHYASLEILENTGLNIHSEEARKLLLDAGAFINGINVKIPSHLVKYALGSAPNRVVMADRLGNRIMPLERNAIYFGTGSDLVNTIDLETGMRRPSRLSDVSDSARLCDALPNIDFIMSYCLPWDVPSGEIEVCQLLEILKNSTKPMIMTVFSGKETLLKVIRICSAVAGGLENLQRNPFLCIYGQFVSPFVHNVEGLERLLTCAEYKIPIIYIPTIMAGISGPVTMAGALATGNAEVLGGLAISQLKRKGAPFIYGGCISSFDMSKMILPYGAPEWHMASAIMSQLSLRYDLPVFSTAGCSDSKTIDGQAVAEGAFSLLMAGLSGANIIHDVGYLESGLTGSLVYLTICDEMIAYVRRVLKNFIVNTETIAVDMIHKVGPGGSFINEDHTLENYKADTWYPDLMDRNNYENWEKSGRLTMEQKALTKVRNLLASHSPIPLSDEILKEIMRIAEQ
jgi:trimethylamine---corrinoid protein Co-methyltransferase